MTRLKVASAMQAFLQLFNSVNITGAACSRGGAKVKRRAIVQVPLQGWAMAVYVG